MYTLFMEIYMTNDVIYIKYIVYLLLSFTLMYISIFYLIIHIYIYLYIIVYKLNYTYIYYINK